MKTAIYIEDGVVQFVITPESCFEKNAFSSFRDKELKAHIFSGSFYDCRGGWVRQSNWYPELHACGQNNDDSLIIRIDEKEGDQ